MPTDPKTYAVVKKQDEDDGIDLAAQVAALSAQVQALTAAASAPSGGITADVLETLLSRVARVTAEAQERAANPSNKTHPGISDFSYPEGDRERPRSLKCEMWWVGYPIDIDITTAEEIELFNAAQPGEYSFKRLDGKTDAPLTVTPTRNANGEVTRLSFMFPVRENRDTLPSMASILRQAFKVKTPQELELESLRKQLEAMKAAQAVTA